MFVSRCTREFETIQNIFYLSTNGLYKLPMEQASLRSFGFYSDKDNAVCLFEHRVGRDVNLEVHRPEWGEKNFDVRFFKSLSDEYRVVMTWKSGKRIIMVGADDLDGGGVSFDVFSEPYEHVLTPGVAMTS